MHLSGRRSVVGHLFVEFRRSLRRGLQPQGALREFYLRGSLFLQFVQGSPAIVSTESWFHVSYCHKSRLLGALQAHVLYTGNISSRVAHSHGLIILHRSEDCEPMAFMRTHKALDSLEFRGTPVLLRAWTSVPYVFPAERSPAPSMIAVKPAEWESAFWSFSRKRCNLLSSSFSLSRCCCDCIIRRRSSLVIRVFSCF